MRLGLSYERHGPATVLDMRRPTQFLHGASHIHPDQSITRRVVLLTPAPCKRTVYIPADKALSSSS